MFFAKYDFIPAGGFWIKLTNTYSRSQLSTQLQKLSTQLWNLTTQLQNMSAHIPNLSTQVNNDIYGYWLLNILKYKGRGVYKNSIQSLALHKQLC